MNSLTQKSDRALTAAALAALVAVLLIMEMTMKSTSILLTVLIYPYFVTRDPLQGLGKGFLEPGTYVSVYDTNTAGTYRVELPDANMNRMESSVPAEDRETMLAFLTAKGADVSGLDASNESLDD